MPWRIRTALAALLVCAACWVGASIGTAVRFPEVGTAVVFPPYAIVTVALLLSPRKDWWVYLVASSLGNFLPHRDSGAPVSFVLMAEAANWVRALVAAAGVRRFGDALGRLQTLRGMAVFMLFAVLLAPVAGAFVGAGVVAFHQGLVRYWPAWWAWLLSNTLTGLTLLPMFLLARTSIAQLRSVRWTRALEAGILLVAILGAGSGALLGSVTSATGLPALLYTPLPFLLWAAVRFGPGGASVSLLVVAVLAIAGAVGGRGPFVSEPHAAGLLELQLFLLATSVPLLLLSALMKERARTAEALRASHEQYQTVVEDQTELVCRFGPDGMLSFVNRACCRSAPCSPADLLGTSFWTLVPPARSEAPEQLLAKLTPEHPIASWEQEIVGPNSPSRWEQWRVRALFDDRGRALHYQAVGRDITERKEAERERELLLAQQTLAASLREIDRRKDEFLATLAHELRNPLAPITNCVEILRRVTSTEKPVQYARDVIARQTAHLVRLVDDLLDVARISTGTIQLRMESVDLAKVLTCAIETSRPLIESHRLELTTDIPSLPLTLHGDAVRLAQLVSNLLNNAAKYTDVGGRITLTVAREPTLVVVRVADTGVGIPVGMLARVFEPFIQVEPSRDRALGGLGLGLPLVKRLVEMHGGTVEAHSDGPGTGSTFVVQLPAPPLAIDHRLADRIEPESAVSATP